MALGASYVVTAATNSNNGTITLTVFGTRHAGVLSFLWSDGVTTQNRVGLSAGTYWVEITEVLGDADTHYATYYIVIPTILTNFLVNLQCCYACKVENILTQEENGNMDEVCRCKTEALILWDIIQQLRCSSWNNDANQCLSNNDMVALVGKASEICGCPPAMIIPPPA